MKDDRVKLLAEIILDPNAADHEKDDAAMDLADYYEDDRGIMALVKVSQNPQENDMFSLDVYGETIANIWLKRNYFDLNTYLKFHQLVRSGVCSVLEYARPEWIKKFELYKHGFED